MMFKLTEIDQCLEYGLEWKEGLIGEDERLRYLGFKVPNKDARRTKMLALES